MRAKSSRAISARLFGISRKEHADGLPGAVHPSGGVDGRRDAEAHFAGVGGAVGESRGFEQGAQTWITRVTEAAQSMLHDHAVFPGEGDNVGYCGDRYQLEERLEDAVEFCLRPSQTGQDRMRQFEGDARAAEVRVGIVAIFAVGIDDGERRRERGFGQVMVGYDDVDAEFVGSRDCRSRSNAVVNADDQPDSARRGRFHR